MRKVLLAAVALVGFAVAVPFAQARPVVGFVEVPGLVQPVQYHGWRERQHERHEYWRWRRHEEWRHRHWAYRHGY